MKSLLGKCNHRRCVDCRYLFHLRQTTGCRDQFPPAINLSSSKNGKKPAQPLEQPALASLPATSEPITTGSTLTGKVTTTEALPTAEAVAVGPTQTYVATCYSLRGRTASGRMVAKGLIAADPRVLPLGSRVRLEAGPFSGEYLVAGHWWKVRGRHIDIWTPSTREAMRFGRRKIKVTVLSYGVRRRARTVRARS